MEHTKGVLFVAPPPPVGPLPASIQYVGLTVSRWWRMMTPSYSLVFTQTSLEEQRVPFHGPSDRHEDFSLLLGPG